MAAVTLITGLAYSFWWGPVVRHQAGWLTPGDVWATFRGAHYVVWGALGDVYGAQIGLVSFPGLLVVLAPFSALTSALNLSESYPLTLLHPTAWFVLGPVTLLMVALPLCGLDALAEQRGVEERARLALTVVQTILLWGMVAFWGHPEDALALGLVAYALTTAHRGSWRAVGWLLGIAVVMQPLSLLVAPALVGFAPNRSKAGLIVRTLLPAAVLASILLVSDFRDTWHALTRQPNFPLVNHATVWAALSPSVGRNEVAAGPGRMLGLACAFGIGLWVWRRARTGGAVDLVWAAAVALAARCVFEPVMVPYYVTPALALVVILTADKGLWRALVASVLAAGLTVMVYTHAGPLRYWLEMIALLGGCLGTARCPDLPRVWRTLLDDADQLLAKWVRGIPRPSAGTG